MICPTCGSLIPDESTHCPVCHEHIGAVPPLVKTNRIWCPSCGAGASWNDDVCPHCGFPIAQEREARLSQVPEVYGSQIEDASDDGDVVDETGDTRTIARIESAIPCGDDPENKVAASEVMPRVSRFALASVASLVLVCAVVLMLTHPWDPDAYSTRATKEADTSMAGFPGTVEELKGQDNLRGSSDESVEDVTFTQISEAYNKLGRYASRADESEESFYETAFVSDTDALIAGKRTADALAVDVDNLAALIENVDMTTEGYEEDRDHLLTLVDWLRKRVESLCTAWHAVADSPDPTAERTRLEALIEPDAITDGSSSYKELFEQNYDQWAPQAKE